MTRVDNERPDVLDVLYEGVYSVDRDRRILSWNKAAEAITGYDSERVVGVRCRDNLLVHIDGQGRRLCDDACPLEQTLADGQAREAEVYMLHRDGHRVPVSLRTTIGAGAQGKVVTAAQVFQDRTSEMAALRRAADFEKLAQIDPLTELANRRLIEGTLAGRLEELRRYGWPVGLVLLDVDDLKAANDRFGHEAGDGVLELVARNLHHNVRSFDLVGRWGGDEFVCILASIGERALEELADRLRLLVAHSRFGVGSTLVQVTVSGGATLARLDDTMQTLIGRADRLLYESKAAGRNRISFDSQPG